MGVGAYMIWGLFPIYFKAVGAVPTLTVLAHRIVWSMVFLALILTLTRNWRRVRTAVRDRPLMRRLALSSLMIALNWGLFIVAVERARVLDASFGYFISPLVSVALGVVVLRERLRRLEWIAVVLAAIGIVYRVVASGTVPWIGVTLALSFAFYGLMRKTTTVDAVEGLFIEAALLAPMGAVYLGFITDPFGPAAGTLPAARLQALLVLAGPVTALPLILFVAAARRIPLAMLGLLQFITPTGQFLLAVFAYREPVAGATLASFVCIWCGLTLYGFDLVVRQRKQHDRDN
jgi:chloramphenicol-sensitive protein RarD